MAGRSIADWMRTFYYGRPISSRTARTAARHYRTIIALFVTVLLVLHLGHLIVQSNGPRWDLAALVSSAIVFYVVYARTAVRLPAAWEQRFYTPRNQLILAQVGILGTSVLVFAYALSSQPDMLWPLFFLPLMAISEYCSTHWLLVALVETAAILVGADWIDSELPLLSFLSSTYALGGAGRAVTIALLGFLMHYTVRNLDAREARIDQLRGLLGHLSSSLPVERDPEAILQTSLDVFVRTVGAARGAVWIAVRQPGVLHLLASTGDARCRERAGPGPSEIVDPGGDQLPSRVIRTGRAQCVARSAPVSGTLDDIAVDGPLTFDETEVEIGVPLKVFQPHRPDSEAVLVLGFTQPMGIEEIRRVRLTALEFAGVLSPIFYYVTLTEELLALRQLGQTVSSSFEQMRVIDALLDLITTTLGFGFATVSLVDEARRVIAAVRGRNVDEAWIQRASHPLDSDDIQADIVRTGRTEILTGWDDRFDREIWERFGHEKMVRIFVPMAVANQSTGAQENIGTVEAGYWDAGQAEITQEQVELLRPFVDQAATAVYKAQLYEQAQRRAKALERLHDVGRAIQRAVWSLPQLMEEIGESALRMLRADIVVLYEYSEDTHQVAFLHTAGEVWGNNPLALRLGEGNILDWMIAQRRPFYTEEAQDCAQLVGYCDDEATRCRTFTQRQDIHAFAGIPLMAGERLIGMMCVNYRRSHRFSDEGRHISELYAQMAAVALESARLKELDKELALGIERSHLAGELHDALVQDLYGIGLKARTLLMQPDLQPGVADTVEQILELAEGANRQIGYMVSELRTPLPGGQDFRATIRETAHRVRQFYSLEVLYDDDGAANVALSSSANAALGHVAKESMTNSVRHARARRIWVHCWIDDTGNRLCLQVRDDGIGFDLARSIRNGHGLRTMNEFARRAGGTLKVHSARGQGTEILVSVPIEKQELPGIN